MNKPKRAAQAVFYAVAVAFVIFLATAVVPLSTGGISVNEPDGLSFEADGLVITLSGDLHLTSDLPYEINNVRAAAHLYAGNTTSPIADTGSVNVSKGDTALYLSGHLPVVNALLYSAYASGTDGIYVPVSLTIQAHYPFSLFGADVRIDTDIKVSDSGHASVTAVSESRITASFSGVGYGSMISDMTEFTGNVDGTDIVISLSKNTNGLVLDVVSSGDITDILTKAVDDHGTITITSSIGNLTLDGQTSLGLIDILKLIQEDR